MDEAYQIICKIIEKDWKNVWKLGVEEIELDFFKLTIDVVNRMLLLYDEELKWVLKTNLFTFVIDHVLEGKGNEILNKLKEEEEEPRTETQFNEQVTNSESLTH